MIRLRKQISEQIDVLAQGLGMQPHELVNLALSRWLEQIQSEALCDPSNLTRT